MRGSAGFRLSTIITVLSVLIVILCVATVTVISKTSIEESSDIEKARLNDEQKIAIQDQMLENINEVHAVLRKLTEKSGSAGLSRLATGPSPMISFWNFSDMTSPTGLMSPM